MKHCIRIEDFTKQDFIDIIDNYKKLKIIPEKDRLKLCQGKILASLFFKESVRTSAIVNAAILKLGGNYISLPAIVTEDENDVIRSLAPFCDLMAIRSDKIDLQKSSSNIKIPLINALCKGTEHTLSALWQLATLTALGRDIHNLSVGIYGQTAHCRPYLTLQKALSYFNLKIYHDPVLFNLANPASVNTFIRANGSEYTIERVENFIDKIDLLLIPDGMPMGGYKDNAIFQKYASQVHIVNDEFLKKLPENSLINYMMPRVLYDGRLTVDVDFTDKRLYNDRLMEESVWATMALFVHLMGIVL